MKKLIFFAFALMVLAQWAVPVKMILDSEAVLQEGKAYKFKTQPIDPSDPFRGKYVTLRFEIDQFVADTLYPYEEDQQVYVVLGTDSAGFGRVKNIYSELPLGLNDDFLKVTVQNVWQHEAKQHVSLNFPFNRFYVEESKASETERVYWNAQRDSTQIAYAVVKIKNGLGIIENVMINGRPILEIVEEMNEKQIEK